MAEPKTFKLKVFSPFENYYEGDAFSLSAKNETGPFDILSDHANFISLISAGEVVIQGPFGVRSFKLNRGILKVHNNFVVLFANV